MTEITAGWRRTSASATLDKLPGRQSVHGTSMTPSCCRPSAAA